MVDKIYTFEGKSFKYPNYNIPDPEAKFKLGRKSFPMSNFGLFDLGYIIHFGLETVEDFVEFIVANRQVIYGDDNCRYTFEYITDDISLVESEEGLRGTLRRVYGRVYELSESVSELISFLGGSPSSLLLVPSNEPTAEIWVFNGFAFSRKISFKLDTSHIRNHGIPERDYNRWYRKLNYLHRVDNDDRNPFRKLKKEAKSPVFYGMELEVNTYLSPFELQYIVTHVEPKQEPFFFMKDDASVSGRYHNNIELVTVPASRKYLKRAWVKFFEKINKLCEDKGVEVSDYFDISSGLSNGLHIHIDRRAFSRGSYNTKKTSITERKFLSIMNDWRRPAVELFQKVSCRPNSYTTNGYCYPDRNMAGRTTAYRVGKTAMDCVERHSVCHIASGKTVEVRLFQGIFDKMHVLRCLDFVDLMVDSINDFPLSSMEAKFPAMIMNLVTQKQRKYPSLFAYLKG